MSEAPEPQAETPVVETEVPAVEAVEVEAPPEAPEPGEETAPAAGEAEPEPAAPKKSPVAQLQGRVGHLTKTLHEKDGTIAEQASQLAAYKALLEGTGKTTPEGEAAPPAPAAAPTGQPLPGSAEFQALVKTEAQKVAAAQKFTADCNSIFEAGEKAHGEDFKEAVTNLNALGLMSEQVVEAAMATGSAADVLHFLGTDVDEAARITSLSPIHMAAELTKLAGKIGAREPPEISKTPAPIKPLGGAVNPEIDITSLAKGDDMNAYAAARKRQGSRWAR